jgi:predicted PurR-regulated permease PerM
MDEGRHDRTPRALRAAAAIAWRALVVAAAVAAALYLLATLRLIFLPVVVALLLSMVLAPPAGWLRHRGWPGTAATLAVFAGSLLLVAGSVTLLAPSVAGELEDLNLNLRDGRERASAGYERTEKWRSWRPSSDRPVPAPGATSRRSEGLFQRAYCSASM